MKVWETQGSTTRYVDQMDLVDAGEVVGYSILFGLLMLPIPHFILNFSCKAQFSKESSIFKDSQPKEKPVITNKTHEETDLDVDLDQDRQPTRMRMSYQQKDEGPPMEEPLYMTDRCIPVKIVFILFTWLFSILVSVYVRQRSPFLSRA